jgi:hypothetical protein
MVLTQGFAHAANERVLDQVLRFLGHRPKARRLVFRDRLKVFLQVAGEEANKLANLGDKLGVFRHGVAVVSGDSGGVVVGEEAGALALESAPLLARVWTVKILARLGNVILAQMVSAPSTSCRAMTSPFSVAALIT